MFQAVNNSTINHSGFPAGPSQYAPLSNQAADLITGIPVKDQLIDQLATQVEAEALSSRRSHQPRVNLALVNTI